MAKLPEWNKYAMVYEVGDRFTIEKAVLETTYAETFGQALINFGGMYNQGAEAFESFEDEDTVDPNFWREWFMNEQEEVTIYFFKFIRHGHGLTCGGKWEYINFDANTDLVNV